MTREIRWAERDVVIRRGDGSVAFEQRGVEAPEHWSDRAVEQCARIYFRASRGVRERSINEMVDRVLRAILAGVESPVDGVGLPLVRYYPVAQLGERLRDMVLSQRFAWNTPVWVNAGADLPPGERPQLSACFIQSVEDNMESIMALQGSETALFRRASGTGTNLSPLRPEAWPLSRGGTASGPVSFARGFDAWAGVTKSGGSSRRAAKMWVMFVWHPDIQKFIACKVEAGRMTRALVAAGWDPDFNAPATAWIPYQNANNSVRVTDEFMAAVRDGKKWPLSWNGEIVREVEACDLWNQVCQAAWECGDPGVQFHDTINSWHTCSVAGAINASNPCSEYLFLDDSACNLASLRCGQYLRLDDRAQPFDADVYEEDVRAAIVSMDANVGVAGYPTEKIARNSRDYRPLGLGYCDLGATLMRLGIAYDSDIGRLACGAVTSLMSSRAALTSAEIARDCGGPFPAWEANRDSMFRVVEKHLEAARALVLNCRTTVGVPPWVVALAQRSVTRWEEALAGGRMHGFRNAQFTVLAPTGTIGFMMDADTTGIEPEIALSRTKRLAAGGEIRMVCGAVGDGLRSLGYDEAGVQAITSWLQERGELPVLRPGEPHPPGYYVRDEHRVVFQTALGDDPIRPEAHVLMVAAAQPFLSGGVSKTVNLPSSATPEDISRIYQLAHATGVKCIAVYRDQSKADQPVVVAQPQLVTSSPPATNGVRSAPPARRKMPDDCDLKGTKIRIAGEKFYFKAGLFEDGTLGEVWITAAKPGSLVHGILDALAVQISLGIQHGVPLEVIVEKLRTTRFPPDGFTGKASIPQVTSCLDALGQWLALKFLPLRETQTAQTAAAGGSSQSTLSGRNCRRGCGIMLQDGACWRCPTCGDSTGGCGG